MEAITGTLRNSDHPPMNSVRLPNMFSVHSIEKAPKLLIEHVANVVVNSLKA